MRKKWCCRPRVGLMVVFFIFLAVVIPSYLILGTHYGHPRLTQLVMTKVQQSLHLDAVQANAMEGFFPVNFDIGDIRLEKYGRVVNIDMAHTQGDLRYNPFIPFLREEGGLMGYIRLLNTSLEELSVPEIDVEAHYRQEGILWKADVGAWHVNVSTDDAWHWQDLAVTYDQRTVRLTRRDQAHCLVTTPKGKTYLFKRHQHTWDNLNHIDTTEPHLFTPLRSLTWTSKGVEVDVGTLPLTVEVHQAWLQLTHGPLVVQGDRFPLRFSLQDASFRGYHCIRMHGTIDSLEHLTIESFEGSTADNDFRGTWTFNPWTQDLRLKLDVQFRR